MSPEADDLRLEHLVAIAGLKDVLSGSGKSVTVRLGNRAAPVLERLRKMRESKDQTEVIREALFARAALALPDAKGLPAKVQIAYHDRSGTLTVCDLSTFLGLNIPTVPAPPRDVGSVNVAICTLNSYLIRQNVPVFIHDLLSKPPSIIEDGELAVPQSLAVEIGKKREELRHTGSPNDSVAIIDEHMEENARHHTLRAKVTDYATLVALREQAHRNRTSQPKVPSANVLLYCEPERELIVHERPEGFRRGTTRPKRLHTFGGCYCAEVRGAHLPHDYGSLLRTARRKLLEECDASLPMDGPPQILHCEETDSGFVQWVVLGRNISSYEYANAVCRRPPNPEGRTYSIGFDRLRTKLIDRKAWHPSGWAHVMMWLAVGAPSQNEELKFDGLTGPALFRDLVGGST